MADTNQPPFLPPSFVNTVPKGGWGTYSGPREDGPGPFANPPNSMNPVRYTGQTQTAFLNVAYSNNLVSTKPPRNFLPSAGPPNISKIP